MSEATAVTEESTTENDDDQFTAGFTGKDEPTETPATEPSETPDTEESVEADPAPAPEPEPELKTLTKAEYEELVNKANAIDHKADKADIDKVFGRFGDLNRIVQNLQAQTPRGAKLELGEEDFKELKEQYGDLSEALLPGLKRILERSVGTADPATTTQSEPALDPTKIVHEAEERARLKAKMEITSEVLDETHAGWRELIGTTPNADGTFPQTEYRKWLATQPADYQQRVNSAYNHVTIGKSIDLFREAQKKAQQATESRQRRIAAAVTPRGTGGHETSGRDENDDFMAGFKSG